MRTPLRTSSFGLRFVSCERYVRMSTLLSSNPVRYLRDSSSWKTRVLRLQRYIGVKMGDVNQSSGGISMSMGVAVEEGEARQGQKRVRHEAPVFLVSRRLRGGNYPHSPFRWDGYTSVFVLLSFHLVLMVGREGASCSPSSATAKQDTTTWLRLTIFFSRRNQDFNF